MEEMKKNDFVVKPCTTCGNPVNIDMERIKYKLDMHFDKKEFDQAERLINYWLVEAKNGNNKKAELELQNEYMGFLRKMNRREDAIFHAEKALEIVRELKLDRTVGGATIFLNVATVYKAFGNPNTAMSFFTKAKEVYDQNLKEDDKLFAGLYNNMALAAVDLKQYDAAENYYKKAISIMKGIENGELDTAISYLNYADLLYAKYKSDVSEDYEKYSASIEENVNTAWKLLNLETTPHDEYYRFVCEKCASSFGFYGFFLYEKELKKRTEVL
ncbi:MAG: tetratricopeptide repeat protein [Lachnospiraceae bacterium]|nr:tetratricopeptide repeat protein [Lachnospiraceae bacterium]